MSTPKNEYLWLKILVFLKTFMKTLKVKKLVCPWRLDIHARNMKLEDFHFHSFFFSFLSHRKHRTVKGGEEILRKNFHVMLNSKSYTYQSLWVKPLKISYSSVNLQWQRRSSSAPRGICPDWGVRNSPVRIAYTVRNKIALRNLLLKIPTIAVLCASCPKISTHLTVISLKGIYVLWWRAAP